MVNKEKNQSNHKKVQASTLRTKLCVLKGAGCNCHVMYIKGHAYISYSKVVIRVCVFYIHIHQFRPFVEAAGITTPILRIIVNGQ